MNQFDHLKLKNQLPIIYIILNCHGGCEVKMGIKFTVDQKGGYYEARFQKNCSDEELLPDYKSFCNRDDWTPELNELLDISNLSTHDLGAPEMLNLSIFLNSVWKKNKVKPKIAIYIPTHSNKNTSILFYVYSEFFERVQIFRDKIKAVSWLIEK